MSGTPAIQHVRQADPNGCVLACIAMVMGLSYGTARARFGDPGTGKSYHWWMDMLGREGFAYQFFFKFRDGNAVRDPWPLPPWAPVHLCCVDAGRGKGTHLCVMTAEGWVFDPAFDAPRQLSDYPDVNYIAGIWPSIPAGGVR